MPGTAALRCGLPGLLVPRVSGVTHLAFDAALFVFGFACSSGPLARGPVLGLAAFCIPLRRATGLAVSRRTAVQLGLDLGGENGRVSIRKRRGRARDRGRTADQAPLTWVAVVRGSHPLWRATPSS